MPNSKERLTYAIGCSADTDLEGCPGGAGDDTEEDVEVER
jgi:hypothetical protein